MQPEIIDSISIAGDRAKPNDDACGAAGNRIWVIDGATGLGGSLLTGNSDAAWLASTANRLFHTHHAVRDSDQLVRIVIEGIRAAFDSERIAEPEARWQLPMASFLLLTISAETVEAVWLADCRTILEIDGKIVTCGETPDGEAEERKLAQRLGTGSDQKFGRGTEAANMLGAEHVLTFLREARAAYNNGHGRWILGLEPKAANHLNRLVIPRNKGPIIGLLMSDGFSALELKYERYDSKALLAAAYNVGLASLTNELRHIEGVEDPAGTKYPRFKRSDDATAMLFRAD
jgi:Protein phosphatase 2C